MKTTRDFDLSFRPETYWEHGDPIAAILAGIKGEARRIQVRAALEAGEEIPEGLLDSQLEEPVRRAWGGIHPFLMGGEYLPADLPAEATIARISLRSTTGDVSEVRARPIKGGLHYRIVDEYETDILLPFDRSENPLTLGELVQLIDECEGFLRSDSQPKLGMVRAPMEYNFGSENGWSDPERRLQQARAFVRVTSEFYPDLELYFEALVEDWLVSKGLVDGTGRVR